MTMKAAAAGPGKPPGTGKAAEAGPDPRRPGLECAPDRRQELRKSVKKIIDNITPWEADHRKPGSWGAFGDLSGQRQRLREAPEGRSSGKVAEICSGTRQRAQEARRTGKR